MLTAHERAVALDVHRQYVMVGAVDAEQTTVVPPQRIALTALARWATQHLRSTDRVVLEATTNAWPLYDLLAPLVQEVVVVHPYHVKVIATSVVKTDKRDTLALARLLAANLLRSIWVPPAHVRELRRLVKHRQQLVSQRAIIRNRLRSVLHTYNLHPPEGEVFSTDHFTWWHSLELPPSVQLQVRHDLTLFECFSALIQDVDGALARLSVSPDWADQVPFIMQLPGVGLITAMTILGAIGDITRFPTPKQLVGYSGLGARVYASGQTFRTGRITKTGRRELRTAMVEVAWGAVRCHPHWRARFERLAARKGKKKAIVAIARSLLVVLWHVLTHREADRDADPQAVARKFLDWGSRHGLATSLGLSRQQFVDYRIQRVGLAKEARSIPA